jgi:hypothetical protein
MKMHKRWQTVFRGKTAGTERMSTRARDPSASRALEPLIFFFYPTNWLLTIILRVGNKHDIDIDVERPHTITTINTNTKTNRCPRRDASRASSEFFFFLLLISSTIIVYGRLWASTITSAPCNVCMYFFSFFYINILLFQSGMHPHNAGFYTNNDTCLHSLSRAALVLDAYIWLRNLRDRRRYVDCRM